jgi:hypothetical protein
MLRAYAYAAATAKEESFNRSRRFIQHPHRGTDDDIYENVGRFYW